MTHPATTAARAADPTSLDRYEMVVGLEVHVQLRTHTKAFCNCPTDFGAAPNKNTCPVCLALPGTLPVLNLRAVELATQAALALECTVHHESIFARKNYFYPDLPKGYQISQFDRPLATGGRIVIGETEAGASIQIGVTRVHMEEDAGKSVHDRFSGVTAIDLNRSGVALVEIVSEPDMRSAAEAGAYLRILKQLLEYTGVSDVSMEEGSLRVDANVSARLRGETRLGTKTEVKNMNSFSGVERALDAEYARQCAMLDRGESVIQQTMLWDGARNEVRPSRTKEGSHDYRYFPDPDLPPLILTSDWIEQQAKAIPELPQARFARFVNDYGLSAYDAEVLTAGRPISDYFESVAREHGDPKAAANWVMGEVMAALNSAAIPLDRFAVGPSALAQLLNMVRDGLLSHSAAKRVFGLMAESGDRPEEIAEREGLLKVDDSAQISAWVADAVAGRPAEWARLREGETKLLGIFVGAVMKMSRGSADPKLVNQLLLEAAGEGSGT